MHAYMICIMSLIQTVFKGKINKLRRVLNIQNPKGASAVYGAAL